MKKYEEGELIQDMNELLQQEFIYMHNKIYHKGWFCSWQIQSAQQYIKHKLLRKAVKKESDSNN